MKKYNIKIGYRTFWTQTIKIIKYFSTEQINIYLTLYLYPPIENLPLWGWGLWTDRVFSLSPGLAQRTPNNNNNNNNKWRRVERVEDRVVIIFYFILQINI